jgi:GntR family transcriptional regulator
VDFLPELRPDGEPVYQQIAHALRAAIDAGTLAPGARVPGENDLMKRYGIARVTARESLALLRNSGLVETVPRVGTFVRTFRPIYRYGSRRLRRERWVGGATIQGAELGGRPLTTDLVEVGEVPADDRLAGLLELAPGARLVRRFRRYRVDDKPVQVSAAFLPAGVVAGSRIAEPDTGPGGTYARLRELGHEPVRWVEELSVRMPTPEEAALLSLGTGTPVATITRTAFTADDTPIEVNDMTFDGSAYTFVYDIATE